MSILQCSSSNFNGSHSTESWSDFVISNGKIQLFWPYWDFISAFLLKPLRIHSRNSSAFQTTLGFSRGGGCTHSKQGRLLWALSLVLENMTTQYKRIRKKMRDHVLPLKQIFLHLRHKLDAGRMLSLTGNALLRCFRNEHVFFGLKSIILLMNS